MNIKTFIEYILKHLLASYGYIRIYIYEIDLYK